ncbi:MAG TPA: aminotransferase class I/II-fold pyridoxal phosphate-dependent enzyme [Gemmatimonadaceae bacterium]|nr:aminotransferase class I/II-fold pyridoxal phosphate-dependent enzyme [Gemmatimonadaceae bacterium]
MQLAQAATLRRLPPYVFAELDRLKLAARETGRQLVDLGIGSPDLPMAPGVIAALDQAARQPGIQGYPPFLGTPRLFSAIGQFMQDRFDVNIDPASEALVLTGAKEGISSIIAALCDPGDVVLVPAIYYPVYARASWLIGAEVKFVPMRADRGFVVDFEALEWGDLQRAKIMIVNYPNNPTGARVDREFYDRAVAFARKHNLLLVSDLAYSELTFDGKRAPSALESDPKHEVTIEFHSCSKTFSMAGLRIGFGVGNAAAIGALAAYRSNLGYGTATPIQHAAAYALEHHRELVPSTVALYKGRRDAMASAFRRAGWDVPVPDATMYFWLPVPGGVDDWDWVNALMDNDGIVVTPGVAFGDAGRGYFRISLVRDEQTLSDAATKIAARRSTM